MDAEDILGSLLRGALAGRRKRSRRVIRFLTRRQGGFVNASTILAAAGLAWGAFEAFKRQSTPSGFGGASPPPPERAARVPEDLVRAVRLLISAARADGTLSDAERVVILDHARQAGAEALVQAELDQPRPLAEIVAGVSDPKRKEDLYVLAFAVVRADETVSGAERIYLAQLASQLGLDPATTARLEAQAAEAIDREPAE